MADSKSVQIASLFRCQLRYCEFCHWRDSRRIFRKYFRRLLACVDEGYRLAILTLTIRNLSSIRSQDYDRLSQNLKMFFQHDLFKQHVYGGLSRIETTFNDNRQEFHPHIHIIIAYRACISQNEIKAVWKALTADIEDYEPSDSPAAQASSRSTWIKKIEFNKSNPARIRKAIRGALNYVCKFNPIASPEAFANYYCATNGKRLVRAYGGLRRRFVRALDNQWPLS
ncbi:MAG TPA: protein rep [Blastocatellia bacterium]|nr:protein rep [Blastocatellia bacterium]